MCKKSHRIKSHFFAAFLNKEFERITEDGLINFLRRRWENCPFMTRDLFKKALCTTLSPIFGQRIL